jgi:hypothetical protein
MRVWAGVAAVMVVMVLGASTDTVRLWTNPEVASVEPGITERADPGGDRPEAGESNDGTPSGVSTAIEIAGWVIVAAFGAGAVYGARNLHWWVPLRRIQGRLFHSWRMPEPMPDVPPAVLDVDVDAALTALSVGEPRNAIVACWMRLESDAAAMGFARLDAETSSEYVARVVMEASVDPGPITDLAEMYREARFSVHALDDDHRARAVDALHRVVAVLRTGAEVDA